MTELEELFYAQATALKHVRRAIEAQQAADEGHGTPENAALLHGNAKGLLGGHIRNLQKLYERHDFDERRMQRAARIEAQTGVEFRGGGEAA